MNFEVKSTKKIEAININGNQAVIKRKLNKIFN